VPDAELAPAAAALAAELARGATLALGRGKLLFHAATSESLETQMELESQGIAASGHTDDFAEGVRAFVEKRAPTFRGR
jgi:2-(1,2-epoxy-1,2-dihydrophenyl)acetyl-CoA isomerase